jgi:hypothetical protein
MAMVDHGLPKVSLGPTMPDPSTPCGQATPEKVFVLPRQYAYALDTLKIGLLVYFTSSGRNFSSIRLKWRRMVRAIVVYSFSEGG